MSSTRMQSRPDDVADHVHHLGVAGPLAPLVDDGEVAVQPRGDGAGAHHAADVRRDDHEVAALVVLLDVAAEQRRGDTGCPPGCRRSPGSAPACRSMVSTRLAPASVIRLATSLALIGVRGAGFAVLPRIAEIRDHRGDPPRRGAAQRVERDQQLHQVVVGRERGGLDDEHVLAADVFLDLDEHLHVGEAADRGLGQRQVQDIGDRLGQRAIAVAGDDFHERGRRERMPDRSDAGNRRLLATDLSHVHEQAALGFGDGDACAGVSRPGARRIRTGLKVGRRCPSSQGVAVGRVLAGAVETPHVFRDSRSGQGLVLVVP